MPRLLTLILALSLVAATLIDGKSPTHRRDSNVAFNGGNKLRPTSRPDDGKPLVVRDVELVDIRDQVGVFIDASYRYSRDEPAAVASSILVERVSTRGFRRTLAGHCEDINIRGSEDAARPVDLTIRDVTIRDSRTQSPPVFLNDGFWRLILITGIRSDRPLTETTVCIDLKGDPGNTSAACVVVLDSPVKVLIQGHARSVGAVISDGSARIETAAVQWRGEKIRPDVRVVTLGVGVRE